MGLIKNNHGVWCAQMRVHKDLQAAVARVMGVGKERQVYLKRSLGTKDHKQANINAKPVLMEFDRIIGEAKLLLKERPLRGSLHPTEIKRMAEAHYGVLLEGDEDDRRDGTGSEPLYQSIAKQLRDAGVVYDTPYSAATPPEAGLSEREVSKRADQYAWEFPLASEALAKGDITFVRDQLNELLDAFQINLDRSSASYRQLGMAVLTKHVEALRAVGRRNAGEPIETPSFVLGADSAPIKGGSLQNAFDGWDKERVRPATTVQEYRRAIEMFIQLHGDIPVAAIKKSHARQFMEALRDVPRKRAGSLLRADLPTLCAWGSKHPEAAKLSAGTINKQFGAVQAIAQWGYQNGIVPDDTPWSDPFHKMRVAEKQSDRTSFEVSELQTVFNAPIFTKQVVPDGARGAAGVWLPLLALFTGARQAEIAGLTVANVKKDATSGALYFDIIEHLGAGKSLKTAASQRAIPVHPQLVKLGFLKYVETRRLEGVNAWLFPTVAPSDPKARPAFSKWFGRYLRGLGVDDTAKVFHSFRHGFKDALRQGGVSQEVHDALTGHSQQSTVSGGYGSKSMIVRFGAKNLVKAVAKVSYPKLDLSRVKTGATLAKPRKRKVQSKRA